VRRFNCNDNSWNIRLYNDNNSRNNPKGKFVDVVIPITDDLIDGNEIPHKADAPQQGNTTNTNPSGNITIV
jgi:hypothetical protein